MVRIICRMFVLLIATGTSSAAEPDWLQQLRARARGNRRPRRRCGARTAGSVHVFPRN